MTNAKKNRFSYSVGERGRNRVRVFAHAETGRMFLEFASGSYTSPATSAGRVRPKVERVALGHSDIERAKQAAEKLAADLRTATPQATAEITLAALFDRYVCEVTPQKSVGKQKHDRRCVEIFRRAFGEERLVRSMSRLEWDRYIRDRRSGKLRPLSVMEVRQVRNRVIAYDLRFLLAVLKWATEVTDHHGVPLLLRNPLKGLPLPKEENPVRSCFNYEQYTILRSRAASIHAMFDIALVLAYETGHRIGSIRQLQWSDILWDRKSIRWRSEHDKMGREHTTPLTDEALKCLCDVRITHMAIGATWIFPSPNDASVPCSRHLLRDWMERGLKHLNLPRGGRWGWHAFRRQFATELKATPLKDLCALGGWTSGQTVLMYTQADAATMRTALENRQTSVVAISGQSTPRIHTTL